MQVVNWPASVIRPLIRTGRLVMSSAWPNLVWAFPVMAVIVGLTKRDYLHWQSVFQRFTVGFTPDWARSSDFAYRVFGIEINSDTWIAETVILLIFLLLLTLILLIVFDRSSHRRRWGRKPAEIERATRYFNG